MSVSVPPLPMPPPPKSCHDSLRYAVVNGECAAIADAALQNSTDHLS